MLKLKISFPNKKVSLSNLAEQSFISKLKQEQGVTYVNKMQEMMSDLEKNKKETESYKSLSHKGMPNNIRLDITVVSQSAWEISNKKAKIVSTTETTATIKILVGKSGTFDLSYGDLTKTVQIKSV